MGLKIYIGPSRAIFMRFLREKDFPAYFQLIPHHF